jgi:hypothetical protein
MEFRYVNPYRDKEEGGPEATANIIYTDLGVSTPASHIFGEGNVASRIIYGGHRLQDNGLNKAKAREVLKEILHRINATRFHAMERFGRHAPLHTIFLVWASLGFFGNPTPFGLFDRLPSPIEGHKREPHAPGYGFRYLL